MSSLEWLARTALPVLLCVGLFVMMRSLSNKSDRVGYAVQAHALPTPRERASLNKLRDVADAVSMAMFVVGASAFAFNNGPLSAVVVGVGATLLAIRGSARWRRPEVRPGIRADARMAVGMAASLTLVLGIPGAWYWVVERALS